MNQDLALIYNTNGILHDLEKVAGAAARRVTLLDLALDICGREGEPDLEKVAEVHAFLVEADGLGRAYAQSKFGELEEAYLSGDENAAAAMREFFGEEKTAGLATRALGALDSVGEHFVAKAAKYRATRDGLLDAAQAAKGANPWGVAEADKAILGAKLKAGLKTYAPEIGAVGAVGAGGYLAGRRNNKTTVVYR